MEINLPIALAPIPSLRANPERFISAEERIQAAAKAAMNAAEHAMAAQFRACIIGDEETARVRGVRRQWAELIAPKSDFLAAAQLPRDQTGRVWKLAGRGGKLEVNRPYFPERQSG